MGDRALDFGARVQIMGILNVTPDSFFDGGRYRQAHAAVERALQMVEEGADLIDIGGESSRPALYGAAQPVSAAEECSRVIPVVEALRRQARIPISIDTTKADVARQALAAGADIVNDISALKADSRMAEVVAASGAPAILMHRGTSPYRDVVAEVKAFLTERLAAARVAGIGLARLAVDPGLGFGKSVAENLRLVRCLEVFRELGCPVVGGASRKSFIWKTLGLQPQEALEGSLAVAVASALQGAHILRVHDVKETVRAVRLAEAITRAT